jgi:hypothetical protein
MLNIDALGEAVAVVAKAKRTGENAVEDALRRAP